MELYNLMTEVQSDRNKSEESVHVLFLSNIMLEPYMELYLRKSFAEVKRKFDYHYIKLEAIDDTDYTLFETADLAIVNLNYECITGQQPLASWWNEKISDKLCDHIDVLIAQIEDKVKKGMILFFELEDFFLPQRQILGNVCVFGNVVDKVNDHLKKVSHEKNIVLLDTKKILAETSLEYAYAYKNRIRWDSVYSQSAIEKFAYEICKQYKVEHQISKKCIVLDCDNVLWGGVLSETGMDNIQLGNQGVGLSYKKFQSFIADLYELGIVLVLCSKNDPEDIKAVFREHKEMMLKEEDISYFAIGWENKTKGILEASQYLNLSLDSMVFVDDNIAEIREVQSILPEVSCVLFDVWNPFQGFRDLFHLSYQADKAVLECRRTTYKTNVLREKQKRNQKDYEHYLKALDTKITIQYAQRNELNRISMLLMRTNKCSNGKRYSTKEMENIYRDGKYDIYAVYAKDCFSQLGLVGAMIVRERKHLDAFSLSCRVLGRGLEQEMFAFIVSRYRLAAYDFASTGKNMEVEKLCRRYISDAGHGLSGADSGKKDIKRRCLND